MVLQVFVINGLQATLTAVNSMLFIIISHPSLSILLVVCLKVLFLAQSYFYNR